MDKHGIPGASVALVKDGRLVFAKGYGQLDKSTGEVSGPNTLFRIASVSKPITGVAIMKLIEEGKLNLSDKVFGSGAILGTTSGSDSYSDWEKEITVRHLLEHTAGGDQWNNEGDGNASAPMFSKPSYNHSELIGWVLDERNPEKEPGTEYDYSNFGYCVLGRIIEEVTGQTYEDYVKDNILQPTGAGNMYIATDTKAGRRTNEAVYYSSNNDPYSLEVERMDAHGGWLASPLALMRFLVRVDGFASKPDILDARTFCTMATPSSANDSYGKGWKITGSNYWHNGELAGSGAILVNAGNGLSWAFLMNGTWIGAADGMMWDVVNGVGEWPGHDWFLKN